MTGDTTPPPPPDERPRAGGPGPTGWDSPPPPPPPPPPPTGQGGPGWTGQDPGGPGRSGQQRGSGSGMDANVASGLAYVLTIITGVIFLVIDRRPEVRFHAMQAIIFGVAWAVVGILRQVLKVQGFQGNHFKLPYIGDLAEQQAGRTS